MEENIAIRITGLSKKYTITEKKSDKGFLERMKEVVFSKGLKNKTKDEGFYALKDINLEIRKGETVGIIGRNGAGKSTLLKILSEVAEPTEGVIEINGTVASVLEVGMGFHPDLSGRENVYLSGAMMGLTKKQIAECFDEIIAFSGVAKFIDTPVKHYSNGMYVRLAFSVVANINADILLFDEVLNFGDNEFQQMCREKIIELINNNKTVVLISHNMNDIIKLCSRVVCLDKGKIIEQGDASISVTHYMDKIDKMLNYQLKYFVDKTILDKINTETSLEFELDFIGLTQNKVLVERPIVITETFEIRFVLKKHNDSALLNLGVIFSTMGDTFLATNSKYPRNKFIEIKNKGIYDFGIEIPDRFFNATNFDVDIFINDMINKQTKIIKSALSFKILPDQNELKMKEYDSHMYFPGPMYTSLNWFAKYLPSD